MNNKPTFHFFALAAVGVGLSGGDRIFIEFARRWVKWGNKIYIHLWEEGYNITQAQKLEHKNIKFEIINMGIWPKFGFLVNYIARILAGIILGLKITLPKFVIVYSCSDFLMDLLPAFLLKARFRGKVKWVAGWYQTAPSPFIGFREGKRDKAYRLTALFYWLSQMVSKPLILRFADFVLVNNIEEKKQFSELDNIGKVVVVLGAVDLDNIKKYLKQNQTLRDEEPKYDAVFQGRFHPQKGVTELIDIWAKVVRERNNAVLAMIGDGELMNDVISKIKSNKLERNVRIFGYLYDGPEKYRIFTQSKVVVHPAFYDSGGMASAEAMAFGLPAVGFDLKSYKSYYPKGMLKVPVGNLEGFSESILKLLNNEKLRLKLGKEGRDMIQKDWSWDKRAREVISEITS